MNSWETNINQQLIHDQFLTQEISDRLRVNLISAILLSQYLLHKYEFLYVLTAKMSQDNLEVNTLI